MYKSYGEDGEYLIDPETASLGDLSKLDVGGYVVKDYISITNGKLSVDQSWNLPGISGVYPNDKPVMILKYLPDEEKPVDCEYITGFCKIDSIDKAYLMSTCTDGNDADMIGYEIGMAHKANFSYDEIKENFVGTEVPCASVVLYDKEKNEVLSKPNAMKILFEKYENSEKEAYEKNEKMRISRGKIEVVVNGKKVSFDQEPIVKDGRTLVPLRAISEALGAKVEWNEDAQVITLTRDNNTIIMIVGKDAYTKNGEIVPLDVPPQIINSRTLVPVRAIAESYGCEVKWDQENKRVVITE